MNVNTEIKREVGWSIVLSVLLIVAGILAIIVPPAFGIAVTILVGWLMVFSGAAHLVYAWHTRRVGGLFWETLLGILYIVTGGYILLHPMAGLVSLTVVLAVCLVAESVLEFILAFQLRPLSGSGWLLLDGIVTLILAILIWRTWPGSTKWVIGTLVGVSMVFSGIARLTISLAARHVAKALREELR
jgi:uncharacterized membrane protein HdeD (DUF308 family)